MIKNRGLRGLVLALLLLGLFAGLTTITACTKAPVSDEEEALDPSLFWQPTYRLGQSYDLAFTGQADVEGREDLNALSVKDEGPGGLVLSIDEVSWTLEETAGLDLDKDYRIVIDQALRFFAFYQKGDAGDSEDLYRVLVYSQDMAEGSELTDRPPRFLGYAEDPASLYERGPFKIEEKGQGWMLMYDEDSYPLEPVLISAVPKAPSSLDSYLDYLGLPSYSLESALGVATARELTDQGAWLFYEEEGLMVGEKEGEIQALATESQGLLGYEVGQVLEKDQLEGLEKKEGYQAGPPLVFEEGRYRVRLDLGPGEGESEEGIGTIQRLEVSLSDLFIAREEGAHIFVDSQGDLIYIDPDDQPRLLVPRKQGFEGTEVISYQREKGTLFFTSRLSDLPTLYFFDLEAMSYRPLMEGITEISQQNGQVRALADGLERTFDQEGQEIKEDKEPDLLKRAWLEEGVLYYRPEAGKDQTLMVEDFVDQLLRPGYTDHRLVYQPALDIAIIYLYYPAEETFDLYALDMKSRTLFFFASQVKEAQVINQADFRGLVLSYEENGQLVHYRFDIYGNRLEALEEEGGQADPADPADPLDESQDQGEARAGDVGDDGADNGEEEDA